MNPFLADSWPVTLAQADTSPAPGSAPVDTSPPPAATVEGAAGEAGAAASGGADGAGGEAAPPANPLGGLLFPVILIIGLMFIFTMGSGRKEKKRRAELMANLTKGAKVQTVGGVLGKVIEVRDDEVVVKVDESTNTSLRFAKSAISSVTSDD